MAILFEWWSVLTTVGTSLLMVGKYNHDIMSHDVMQKFERL